jgi:hypothetical protein
MIAGKIVGRADREEVLGVVSGDEKERKNLEGLTVVAYTSCLFESC